MATFPERLVQLKIEKNLLQKNIAKETDVSLRAYRYYETGEKEPTLGVLIKLADYFDVSLDWLTGRSETRERQP